MNRSRIALAVALLATLIAAYFAPEPEGNLATPAAQAKPAMHLKPIGGNVGNNAGAQDGVLSIRPRQLLVDAGKNEKDEPPTIFSITSWTPPPPPPAETANVPPPPPQAPPLPFRALGRYVEDGKVAIFLQLNDRNLVVRVGDMIDGIYKVESLNGGVLSLNYLPLNQVQPLQVGLAN